MVPGRRTFLPHGERERLLQEALDHVWRGPTAFLWRVDGRDYGVAVEARNVGLGRSAATYRLRRVDTSTNQGDAWMSATARTARLYAARLAQDALTGLPDGSLGSRGLGGERGGAVAAVVADRMLRRAGALLPSPTPDMRVVQGVAVRAAQGKAPRGIPAVEQLVVHTVEGQPVSLDVALRSGVWFHLSEESVREKLHAWAEAHRDVVIERPWCCQLTFDAGGRWKEPRRNLGTLIAGMYGVGRPRARPKFLEGRRVTLWRFDEAQRRQLARDAGVDFGLDFAAPDAVIEDIAADDPSRDIVPHYALGLETGDSSVAWSRVMVTTDLGALLSCLGVNRDWYDVDPEVRAYAMGQAPIQSVEAMLVAAERR